MAARTKPGRPRLVMRALFAGLLSAAVVLACGAAWVILAPANVGGETSYLTTRGISMEPRFHTGDLALIRADRDYRVGDVIAYHSTVLHTVVMHRIVTDLGGRFVVKGDNNTFVDPTHPTNAEVVGRLMLRVPHGGRVLGWLHTPIATGGLLGGLAAVLLFSAGRQRRRRDRRRPGPTPPRSGDRPVASQSTSAETQQILTVSVAAAALFAVLALIAFTRPTTKPTTVKTPFTEKVTVATHAAVATDAVYPNGQVNPGDPIFLRLVSRLGLIVDYRLSAKSAHTLAGTMAIMARLTSPTGWTRDIPLAPATRFAGDHASDDVTLDLTALLALTKQVELQSATPAGGDYTLEIIPTVHAAGTLDRRPLTTEFAPAATYTLNARQLTPAATPKATIDGPVATGLDRTTTVAEPAIAAATIGLHGRSVPVSTLRLLGLLGVLLAVATAVAHTVLSRLRRPANANTKVIARHAHLIVPIDAMSSSAYRPPIDVTSMHALVQLAERSERLILHHQCKDGGDTYLVDDEGTHYRYQTRPAGHSAAPVGVGWAGGAQ